MMIQKIGIAVRTIYDENFQSLKFKESRNF